MPMASFLTGGRDGWSVEKVKKQDRWKSGLLALGRSWKLRDLDKKRVSLENHQKSKQRKKGDCLVPTCPIPARHEKT